MASDAPSCMSPTLTQDMATVGSYDESLCYPFIGFWKGWAPDGSPCLNGQDASGNCGASGPCYQAFYFQSLKFTPSANNRIVTLACSHAAIW